MERLARRYLEAEASRAAGSGEVPGATLLGWASWLGHRGCDGGRVSDAVLQDRCNARRVRDEQRQLVTHGAATLAEFRAALTGSGGVEAIIPKVEAMCAAIRGTQADGGPDFSEGLCDAVLACMATGRADLTPVASQLASLMPASQGGMIELARTHALARQAEAKVAAEVRRASEIMQGGGGGAPVPAVLATALEEGVRLSGVLNDAWRGAEAAWELADAATAAAKDLPATEPVVEASAPHLRTTGAAVKAAVADLRSCLMRVAAAPVHEACDALRAQKSWKANLTDASPWKDVVAEMGHTFWRERGGVATGTTAELEEMCTKAKFALDECQAKFKAMGEPMPEDLLGNAQAMVMQVGSSDTGRAGSYVHRPAPRPVLLRFTSAPKPRACPASPRRGHFRALARAPVPPAPPHLPARPRRPPTCTAPAKRVVPLPETRRAAPHRPPPPPH